MMFPIPISKKYYVIVGAFDGEWFLRDADTKTQTTYREWINTPSKAIQFKSQEEAEQVGELVLSEDEFTIESYTKFF
jgi:phosphoenolpyruvate synthase/pyruvate phosphate dikinase